ncbi:hypothetical protein C0993_011142 [Termitomyces sp. T159_Od127]|nr:hypothetical protein C0993_011142 [Termitomyces sp. T159_Od127]
MPEHRLLTPQTPMTLGPVNPNEANLSLLYPTSSYPHRAGKVQWNVNNVSYLPPEIPTLVKVLDSANNGPTFSVTENTIILPKNTVVEAVFPPK